MDDVREAANNALALVALGQDRAKARAEERREAKATLRTLVSAADDETDSAYAAALAARHVVKVGVALSALRRNRLSAHGSTDVKNLTRLDLTTAMAMLEDAGKPGAAQGFP